MSYRSAPGLLFLLIAGCGDETISHTATTTGTGGGAGGPPTDVEAFLVAPKSCAYVCPNDKCAENETPYACPAMAAWDAIPHADTCPKWDGTYPTPAKGECAATPAGADAIRRPGADIVDPSTRVLPGGRRSKPAGFTWDFDEADIIGGTTSAVAVVPGTSYVIAVDTGNDDHAVRAIDTSLVGVKKPVTGFLKYSPHSYLNSGIAVVAPDRVYVATGFGAVLALSLDLATGALTELQSEGLALPLAGDAVWYASSIAATPDGKRLVVTAVNDTRALVYDIDPSSASYKQQLGAVDMGARDVFAVAFDATDTSGRFAYASVWGGKKVVEIDLLDPAAPVVARTFATDENPQGIAFLDARWMAVANDLGETISLVDRVTGEVTSKPVDFVPGLKGLDVSGLAWDPAAKRLYAVLAGIDAIGAYDVDLTQSPPALTPAGRLPTAWWPSGVAVQADGSLVVVNLRGHPIGVLPQHYEIGHSDGSDKMRGSIQRIPAPTAADLVAGDVAVKAAAAVGARDGYPKVVCPGANMDFPVPPTNTMGPSEAIQHVFFIVRENKTFDALLGDMPTVDGDPSLAMKETTEEMEMVWPNFRDLGRQFVIGDNFYNVAVKSTQGHQWTTYGRTTDFCERTWSADLRQVPLCGITDIGRPKEGSLFEWLQKNDVVYDILGEIVGTPGELPANGHNPIDVRYPGGPFQNITYNDLEKSCYLSARMRVACNLSSFAYITFPNDHTVGISPENPTPETMCGVNDEATGMFIDALSHSPLWASSLVIITEDDPQQGGDHVDYHRTPLVVISPWAKRGHVSRTHIDVASLHKLFAHVFGIPYPNLVVQNAGLPLDMFTSTPDFTPYTYTTHRWPVGCGQGASAAEQRLTGSWDFSIPDTQEGLGDQVMRWMRGRQLTTLPPRIEAQIAAREARRAAGLPAARDDDDD